MMEMMVKEMMVMVKETVIVKAITWLGKPI